MRVLISGGGTGGHVYPAIALANAIKDKDPSAEILFVGAQGKLEMKKVPAAGYFIKGLWISGFQRKLSFRNLSFPFKLASSLYRGRKIIMDYKPDVVVGVGGYASGPILQVASMMKIPTLIQEQNSYPGITNKILAKKVNKICVAYDGMERFFPSEKIIFTGNPVRRDLYDIQINREEAKASFGIDNDHKTVLIFGGSLGARRINESVEGAFDMIKRHSEINYIWQVGKMYFDEYSCGVVAALPNITVLPFIERMDYAYAAADAVVCRAGALTISEIALINKPAVLIPSPHVAEDHQTKNAMALVNNDAALMVPNAEAKEKMIPTILELLSDEKLQQYLVCNLKKMGRPNATSEIVEEIFKLVK
ncbi:MAG TPA: undecaprenyldiphospho-muramoylpentapeptide beta-N-acetylglucosaminyltransferase [Saprospirales bacterium]|jgi:UDP-N-acetylglucosamine--N-acetylmuramyl-(pentapeptide) pyrophosphoryl-undecaprenol N-acetylglucosamine transferase|nr:undecaprenyldiphospho-muramoylpentapeptide beta-N-acetylglucosaminyltransferase [Saprospiraceae bacterium]HAW05235.1 undecaprenyldiphospho-muramoylpentapeptide beta-N-acetylglucosaminyltransferase [Saprospirales bacterium]